MADKRNYNRFFVRGSVKLKTENAPMRVLDTELIDACFIGISVLSKERIEIGTVVHFELKLDPLEWVFSGKGKVKNISEVYLYVSPNFRIGIEFIETDKGETLELINKVQAVSAKERRRMRLKLKERQLSKPRPSL